MIRHWTLAVALTAVAAGAGCGSERGAPTPTDPSVKHARAAVDRALTATADYRGPDFRKPFARHFAEGEEGGPAAVGGE